MFAHVNALGVTAKLAIPHASLDALFTAKESMLVKPELLKYLVTFLQIGVGDIVSNTVTVELQTAELPDASVTVIVTVFAPIFAHVKLFGLTAKLEIPHASLDALFTDNESIVRLPVLFKYLVMFLQTAKGATVSNTVTVDVHVELLP